MDEFEWDENKRISNLEKHSLDFLDAIHVFNGPYLRAPAKTVRGEVRVMAVGMLDEVCVTIIFVHRAPVIRLISMRKARFGERERYEKVFGD